MTFNRTNPPIETQEMHACPCNTSNFPYKLSSTFLLGALQEASDFCAISLVFRIRSPTIESLTAENVFYNVQSAWSQTRTIMGFGSSGVPGKSSKQLELQGMDGGFPSVDSMLQWAVGHSDPEKLKAAAVEAQILSPEELEKRRVEIKGLMEDLRMPSDAALMKIAIADINNSSLSTEGHYRALLELLELVGPIDNANDLNKLGGLTALVKELNREEKELRTIAAWVLGQASTNNPVVQTQIIELNVLPKLMGMVKSSCSEEAVKALYAVSAIIRNNLDGQAVFYFEGGAHMLQDIMANDSSDIRLRRKSVVVVADLAEQQFELEASGAKSIFEASKEYLKSVVDLMAVPDLDIQEKALVALSRLLQVSDKNVQILRDFGQLELALERLRFRLRELMRDENQGDFLRDIEAQRQEVEFMLRKKL